MHFYEIRRLENIEKIYKNDLFLFAAENCHAIVFL